MRYLFTQIFHKLYGVYALIIFSLLSLIALFFAKLFGVQDIVDISPLFETPAALETGARLIERRAEN